MAKVAAETAVEKIHAIEQNIARVFLGKPEAIRLMVVGLLGGGHILIEDVPGVGKTVLAKALARSLDCSFQRIQFTADLLPSDILGVSIYEADKASFVFNPGPIFAHIVLADEINRGTPRTQGSLLEAMNELRVTVDRVTHELPQPFMVLATQNPFEYEGTFPLPQSELDRFFLRTTIGYPPHDYERQILERQLTPRSVDALEPVVSGDEVLELQNQVAAVRIEDSLLEYLLTIVARTRREGAFEMGVSPRGALMLSRGCRALALAEGRAYCLPDDVKRLVIPILQHRLLPRGSAGGENENGDKYHLRAAPERVLRTNGTYPHFPQVPQAPVEEALSEILRSTPVPV